MISKAGVVFEKKTLEKRKKKTHEGLNGDSGVGQAPESSFKPLLVDTQETSVKKIERKNTQVLSRVLPKLRFDYPPMLAALVTKFSLGPRTRVTRRFINKKQPSYSPLSLRLISTIGTLLILISVIGAGLTYGPLIVAEARYRMRQLFSIQNSQRGSFADILNSALIGDIENAPDPNFSLVIPKIGARGKVIANVDAGNEVEYMDALKIGIAHAKGTQLPGSPGTIYMFAHSTDSPLNIIRYNAVFYLLRELQAGDEVLVYFSGAKHRYRVTETKIVEPTDVEYLSSINPENKELLILQTCWPPGTRLKRFLVFARKPIDIITDVE